MQDLECADLWMWSEKINHKGGENETEVLYKQGRRVKKKEGEGYACVPRA